jgi:hypothetical protein
MAKRPRRRRRVRRAALAALLFVALSYVGVAVVASQANWLPPRLPESFGSDVETREDPRLAGVASVLAGRRARVRCWSRSDWKERTSDLERRFPTVDLAGPWRAHTVPYSVPVVEFSPEICAALTALADGAPVRSSESPEAFAWALSSLAHEAVHASGVLREAEAECYGIQSIRRASMLLGRTSAEGQYLAALYWKRWYRWHDRAYRSAECRNGGRLDVRRATNVWP